MKSIIKLFLLIAASFAALNVLAADHFVANYYCRVTFGTGDGAANNYTTYSGDFGQIPFSQLAGFTKTDPGANYHETGKGFGDYYLVPTNGVYEIVVTLRQTDGAGSNFTGDIAFDGNVSTDGMGYDSPGTAWYPVAPYRGSFTTTRIASFTEGEKIIAFTGSDSNPTCSAGTMTIAFLHN